MLRARNIEKVLSSFSLSIPSLEIEKGETVAIMGLSGSGKTTAMEILSSLESPDKGTVELEGGMFFIYQNPFLEFFTESVEEELLFGLDRRKALSRINEALSFFGLEHSLYMKKSPYELSGGEAIRVLLAASYLKDPEYLFLDEPLSSLDEDGVDFLSDYLEKRREEGKTTIFSSHDVDYSLKAERLLVFSEGRVIHDGPTTSLLDSWRLEEFGFYPGFYAKASGYFRTPISSMEELIAIVEERRGMNVL